LQIATKDFLNEFVRRFPERPPPRPSRAQRRILEMIEEWRATIVVSARDPKDFAHIRDMHRLLRMKGIFLTFVMLIIGYIFPQVTVDAQAVMGPSDVFPYGI
jgi:ADP-ribosylation factor-binding protein GGA